MHPFRRIRAWISAWRIPSTAEWWRRAEVRLLWIFLGTRLFLFLSTLGHPAGFDIGAHIEMLEKLSWMHPTTDIRGSFYGYHPPLGFLLPRAFLLLGFTPEVSIQMISALASLIAFFALRATLKSLHLLAEPRAIALLYLSSTLPIQTFLATSANLDVLVLALSAIVLLLSVRLLWCEPELTVRAFFARGTTTRERVFERWSLLLALTATLALGMLFKFSALLAFAIPPIVAVLRPQERERLRSLGIASGVCVAALLLVTPYYVTRYYGPEARLFPTNDEWIVQDAIEESKKNLRENPILFLIHFVESTPVHRERGITHRDYDVLRFRDTWRDFFVKDQFLGPTDAVTRTIGDLERKIVPWLLLLGAAAFVLRSRHGDPWIHIGIVLLAFSALEILAFVTYLMGHPFPGWGPAKGIYIAPVAWGIGFLLACLLPETIRAVRSRRALLVTLAVIILAHHLLPAYA